MPDTAPRTTHQLICRACTSDTVARGWDPEEGLHRSPTVQEFDRARGLGDPAPPRAPRAPHYDEVITRPWHATREPAPATADQVPAPLIAYLGDARLNEADQFVLPARVYRATEHIITEDVLISPKTAAVLHAQLDRLFTQRDARHVGEEASRELECPDGTPH